MMRECITCATVIAILVGLVIASCSMSARYSPRGANPAIAAPELEPWHEPAVARIESVPRPERKPEAPEASVPLAGVSITEKLDQASDALRWLRDTTTSKIATPDGK